MARIVKVHYEFTKGEPICGIHKSRTTRQLELTIVRPKVTCSRCRACFGPKTAADT